MELTLFTPFLLWVCTFLCFFYALHELKPLRQQLKSYLEQTKRVEHLRRSVGQLKLISEMLESGVVPESDEWQRIRSFPKPWAHLIFESVMELRAQGAPLLPTLHRTQKTLEEEAELILEGKVKSAQAFGQAFLGVGIVPVFGSVLYLMLPQLEASSQSFFILCLVSFFLASLSCVWMISMVDRARFGGLRVEHRSWLVSVNIALERMMALITTGMPADLAYKQAMEDLHVLDPSLVYEWKFLIWEPDTSAKLSSQSSVTNECERLIGGLGNEIRRTIQSSLLEGRGCLDRLEAIHRTYLIDLRMRIGRELNLLANRCLKPLFLCVFPAVMLLLLGSFFMCFQGLL